MIKVKGSKKAKASEVLDEAEENVDEASSQESETTNNETSQASEASSGGSAKSDDEALEQVRIQATPKDHVKVSFVKAIDPAPRIGNYDIREKHKISKITIGQALVLPKSVALWLIDRKKCVLSA